MYIWTFIWIIVVAEYLGFAKGIPVLDMQLFVSFLKVGQISLLINLFIYDIYWDIYILNVDEANL